MKIRLVKPAVPKFREIAKEVKEMLASGELSNFGKNCDKFEALIKKRLKVRYAICVSSATAGLMLLLRKALGEKKSGEVILPSFTFLATVQAVLWNSLKPVFADIDRESFNISPDSIRKIIRKCKNPVAIIAVHTFGTPCEIEELEAIAGEYGVPLYFDSAHALGSMHNGRLLGGFGDAEVFSLSPTKLLPCGEGGVVTSQKKEINKWIWYSRNYGFIDYPKANSYRPNCDNMGFNAKLPEFNAILGIHGLENHKLDYEIERRNDIARKYIKGLEDIPDIQFQKVNANDISTYKDFTIVIRSSRFGMTRDQLHFQLLRRGIETLAYFSPALHQMKYFKKNPDLFITDALPNTNYIEKRILSLPIYSSMKDNELQFVVDNIWDLYIRSKRNRR